MENNTENPEVPQEEIVTKLYAYGSAECDQYRVSDDEDENESKRPVDLTPLLSNFRGKILNLVCGGLHTVLLTSFGEVFTFGCNDDGALGRDGEEKIPGKVDLGIPVNMISAGDSHTVACNSEQSTVFHWGVYRNVHKGNISKSEKPHKIGESDFRSKKITKILSGAHHTMVLADEKIFAWGDSDAGILGRVPTDRRKLDQGLKIEGMGIKGVKDIFTGAYHSFLLKEFQDKENKDVKYTSVFAWGNNNCGQLGIGHEHMFSAIPIEIVEFKKKNIVQITGGEHHTVALSADGEVFTFGKNDDGQLGLGEDYEQPASPAEGEVTAEGEIKAEEKKPDRTETKFVSRPTKVKFPENAKISQILSGSSFNYAIATADLAAPKDDEKRVFSWGVGDNYVLGTREEDTLYEPQEINRAFFKGGFLYNIALSAQHVVFTSGEEPVDRTKFEVDLKKVEEKKAEKKKAGKSKEPKAEKAKAEKAEEKEEETAVDEEKPAEEKPKRGGRKKPAEKEDKKEEKSEDEKNGKESASKEEKTEEKSEDEEEPEPKAAKETKKPARGRSTKKKEEKEEKEEEKAEPKEAKKGRKATTEKKSEEKEAPKSTRPTRSQAAKTEKSTEKKADDKKAKGKSSSKSQSKSKSKSKSPEKKKEDKKDAKGAKKVHDAKKRKADDAEDEPKAKKVKKTTKK